MDLLGSLFTLIGLFIAFVIWMLPIIFIALSDRTDGKEKVAWILAVIFISWFAWVFYLLLALIKPRDAYQSYR